MYTIVHESGRTRGRSSLKIWSSDNGPSLVRRRLQLLQFASSATPPKVVATFCNYVQAGLGRKRLAVRQLRANWRRKKNPKVAGLRGSVAIASSLASPA